MHILVYSDVAIISNTNIEFPIPPNISCQHEKWTSQVANTYTLIVLPCLWYVHSGICDNKAWTPIIVLLGTVDQFLENFLLTMILRSSTNTSHFHGNQPIFVQLFAQCKSTNYHRSLNAHTKLSQVVHVYMIKNYRGLYTSSTLWSSWYIDPLSLHVSIRQ